MKEILHELKQLCNKIDLIRIRVGTYSRVYKKYGKTYEYSYVVIKMNGKERFIKAPKDRVLHYAIVLGNIAKALQSLYFMCKSLENIDVPQEVIDKFFEKIEELKEEVKQNG